MTAPQCHLLFDIDYRYDTVNLISLYNHAHGDEVVAMLIKKGTAAQILLFDFRLEAIDLHRRSGRHTFVDFLQNFREAFIHFAEMHHPEGKAVELARSWRSLADRVTFEVPGGQSANNQHHLNVILRELYGLKLILAASLLDRCLPNSAEYQIADRHLKTYPPRRSTENRMLRLGKPEVSWSRVVFGLPQLDDLFDDLQDEPGRLQARPARVVKPDPARIVISKDDLDIPAEYRDFWDVVKIDPN